MSGEFWAAIFGAIVGGLISLGIQVLVFREATRRHREEAMERNKALAHSLLFKMIRIHSNLHHFANHLRQSKSEGEKHGLGNPWQYVRPLANLPDPVHWNSDEMSLLLSLKEDDLFNSIVSMDVIHNSTLELFKTHRDVHADVAAHLPGDVVGGVAQSELSSEQAKVAGPKVAGLNVLVEGMIKRCQIDVAEASTVLTKLNKALNERLGLSYKIEDRQP